MLLPKKKKKGNHIHTQKRTQEHALEAVGTMGVVLMSLMLFS